MRGLSLLLLLVVLAVLVTLGVQNQEGVSLTFLNWSVVAALWMVVTAGFLLGMFGGWAIAGLLKRSWYRVVEPGRAARLRAEAG